MEVNNTKFFTLILSLLIASSLIAQNSTKEVREILIGSWYSIKVGNPNSEDLKPTKNPEVMTFKDDGTVNIKQKHSQMGEMEMNAGWEYIEQDNSIVLSMDFNGVVEKSVAQIRRIDSESMVLDLKNKAVEYSINPPLPKASAPVGESKEIVSNSTIDIENWTGIYPIKRKIFWDNAGKSLVTEVNGNIALLKSEGKRQIRYTEGNNVQVFDINQGAGIAGNSHYGIITEDEEIAGEFVYTTDGFMYYYKDKDQSTTEFYGNSE